jgi:hypothetical protein
VTTKTYLRADGQYTRVLARRILRRSLLVAEWQPPGRYSLAGLAFYRDGAIMLTLGRLELSRYRSTRPLEEIR